MKIAYLMELGEEIRIPPFSGPANHVRQVFRHLALRGHETTLLFRLGGQLWITHDLNNYQPIFVRWIDSGLLRTLERGVRRVQDLLKLPFFGFFDSLRFAMACWQELPGCDLYYERFSWMKYGGLLAAMLHKVPRISEYNGDPLADLQAKSIAPSGLQKHIAIKLARWTLRKATAIVATGDGWKQSVIQTWGTDPGKVAVVENGTDLLDQLNRSQLQVFQPAPDADEELRIVYLGGFYPWHGINQLLQATARLVREGVRMELMLIGGGQGYDDACKLVSELGLTACTRFTGRLTVEEYAPHLAAADIGVSPYCGWKEYSGLKIFDYKAAGLACVASGENGQPAILRHGETGWIVPPCDVDALAEALMMLAGDASLRRRLGQQARLEAEKTHSWSHTVMQLEDVFLQAMEK